MVQHSDSPDLGIPVSEKEKIEESTNAKSNTDTANVTPEEAEVAGGRLRLITLLTGMCLATFVGALVSC